MSTVFRDNVKEIEEIERYDEGKNDSTEYNYKNDPLNPVVKKNLNINKHVVVSSN